MTYASPSSSEPLLLLARFAVFFAGVFLPASPAGESFLPLEGAGEGDRESSLLISMGSSLSDDSSPPASSRSWSSISDIFARHRCDQFKGWIEKWGIR